MEQTLPPPWIVRAAAKISTTCFTCVPQFTLYFVRRLSHFLAIWSAVSLPSRPRPFKMVLENTEEGQLRGGGQLTRLGLGGFRSKSLVHTSMLSWQSFFCRWTAPRWTPWTRSASLHPPRSLEAEGSKVNSKQELKVKASSHYLLL